MLLITFGYAYLSAGLNISGSSTIHNATWSIYWDNVQVTTGSVSASTPVIDTAKTTVSYNIILEKPGDFYEFTVDVKNDGTIDAMIESISSKLNGVVIQTLPSYLIYSVTYADDVEIQNNQLLSANSSDTYKVRIEYKRDITISDMPTTQQNLSLSFSVNYIQANNNATRVRGKTSAPFSYQKLLRFIYKAVRTSCKPCNPATRGPLCRMRTSSEDGIH